MIAAYNGLVRRSTRGRRGEETTVSAARAGKLAAAAGLDPHTVYRVSGRHRPLRRSREARR